MTPKPTDAELKKQFYREFVQLDFTLVTAVDNLIASAKAQGKEEGRRDIDKILDARRDSLHRTLKDTRNGVMKFGLMSHLNEIANIEEELKQKFQKKEE